MKIKDIIEWLKATDYKYEFVGNDNTELTGFSSLSNYMPGSITWIKKAENIEKFGISSVLCAVVEDGIQVDIPNIIISGNSKEVFFGILHHFWGKELKKGFIGSGTFVSPTAEVDPTVYIGHNCTIDGDIVIGANTIIENNVVIQGKVNIGENCHIQSQVVIGLDGFGFSKDKATGKMTAVEHFGGVQIGNDVFIGSHVNIARGTIDNTIICDGVKIAPSTHIGHNNYIGEDSTIICSLIYGSCVINKNSYVTASTIQNQMSIGRHTVIGMGSVVTKSIPDNVVAFGIPAKVMKENNTDL